MALLRAFKSSDRSTHYDRIHWRAPALMTGSLIVGAAFAVAHHAFYNSLNGTEVRSAPYQFAGWQITPQQLNTAGGTAFAFAVKASLILAISTAYVQLFFRAVSRVGHEFTCIDSWFSGLGDVTSLFGVSTFWTQPLLAVVALTAWLLPIAAIVTPATLSVTFDHLPPVNESHFVPLPAFASLKMVDYNTLDGGGFLYFGRASAEATRIVQAAATAGSILPIAPPAVNSSWIVTMSAPRLACDQVDDARLRAIKDNLALVFGPFVAFRDGKPSTFASFMFSYMSWPAATDEDPGAPLEMPFRINETSEDFDVMADALEDGFDWPRGMIDSLYVAALPRLINVADYAPGSFSDVLEGYNISTVRGARKAMDWAFEEATVLRCQLVASDYTLRFDYSGSLQEQAIDIVRVADVAMDMKLEYTAGSGSTTSTTIGVADSGCFYLRPPISLAGNPEQTCAINTTNLVKDSYQALMGNYAKLTLGTASFFGRQPSKEAFFNETNPAAFMYTSTNGILSTSLAETAELEPLNRFGLSAQDLIGVEVGPYYEDPTSPFYEETSGTVDEDTADALEKVYSLLGPPSQSAGRQSLKDAVEELFFNITVSMASSSKLTYNITAPNAPENVTVTINKMGNKYSYSAEKLWLAYGLAIGITIVNVGLGLLTIFKAGSSFTLNFSTIVRATKNAHVSIDTGEQENPGKDPLPEQWKQATYEIRPSAAYEVQSLKSGAYSSVNQAGEERETPAREDDGLSREGRLYVTYDDRRRTRQSAF